MYFNIVQIPNFFLLNDLFFLMIKVMKFQWENAYNTEEYKNKNHP